MSSTDEITGATFYNYLNEHKLMGIRCKACGHIHVPPRPVCPGCRDAEIEWVEMSGRGKLAAFTIIYIAPTPMLAAGYSRKHPYCSGIVELEEGARISA
ncbi:MAG: Zn-ribbon domain-containing OB-fold protein, partial [Anaerolineae bacterium]